MRRDLATGLCFLTVSGFFLAYGLQMPLGKASRMGPGYLPVAGAVLLAGLALVILFQDFRTRSARKIPAVNWRGLGFITGAVVFFGVTLSSLGLVLTTICTVMIGALAEKPFRAVEALLLGAVLAAASSGIFVYGIGMLIPVWPNF